MGRTYQRQVAIGAATGLALLLAAFDISRIAHHAMWRDEIQAFLLAAGSRTPVELFLRLHYEDHPGVWHLLLWVISRATSWPREHGFDRKET